MLDPNNVDDVTSISKSREITKEILNFGVNDKEIIKIIQLLSLELENTILMKEISNAINNQQEETKQSIIER